MVAVLCCAWVLETFAAFLIPRAFWDATARGCSRISYGLYCLQYWRTAPTAKDRRHSPSTLPVLGGRMRGMLLVAEEGFYVSSDLWLAPSCFPIRPPGLVIKKLTFEFCLRTISNF